MAKVTVVRAKPVEPPVEKIVLEMTPEEAAAVLGVLGHATKDASAATYDLFSALKYVVATAGFSDRYRVLYKQFAGQFS